MSRLIDADVLSERLKNLDDWCRDLRKPGIEQARSIVHEAPTVDAVPVVRCKDCVYYENEKHSISRNCIRNGRLTPMLPADYCSYGKRKEDI